MPVAGFAYDFTGISGRVIAVWYKNSNLSAEVSRKVLDLPNGEGSFSVENLQNALYVFKFYQSSDGATLETFLRQINYNAKTNKLLSESFEYVVGRGLTGDPAADSNILADTRLADAIKDELEVKRRGLGTLRTDEFELHSGGGIELQNGDLFGEGETFHITWYHKGDAAIETASTTSEDIVVITSDTPFDAALHIGKTVYLKGGANIVEVLFPSFSSIIDGKVRFVTTESTARYLRLKFASGNSVHFFGSNRNKIYLGVGESFELQFKGGKGYAVSSVKDTGYERAGETEMSNKKSLPNTHLCSGDGVEHWITDYERMMDELPAEMKVSYPEWDQYMDVIVAGNTKRYYHNRKKFAVDTTNGKFKFPDLRGVYFKTLVNVEGGAETGRLSSGAGGFMPQQLIKHNHPIKVTDGDQGNTTAIADGGNSAYTVTQSNTISVIVGGDNQEVDNAGKYGIVWM